MPLPQGPHDRLYPFLHGSGVSEPRVGTKLGDSIRTEDDEGSFLDVPMDTFPPPEEGAGTESSDGEALCSDRAELIERLKRGESPQWVPNPSLQQEYLKANGEEMPFRPANVKTSKPTGALLPPAELHTSPIQQRPYGDVKSLAMEIKRPHSALHAGDFTEDSQQGEKYLQESSRPAMSSVFPVSHGPLGASPTSPWYTPFTPASSSHDRKPFYSSFRHRDYDKHEERSVREQAPSLASSFSSSSYILKAPTTPLVQQSNNTDLDFSARDRSTSPDKASRRHTLPTHALQNLHADQAYLSSTASSRQHFRPPCSSSYQRESNLAFVHRSRRSLTTNWTLQQSASPSTPSFNRSRRTSFSSEASPLQHASMVGSYEESILRGRMSTAPSKPVNFTAQIGVLGKGNCKPKCPAHVTVPFPAVYYSWASGNGRRPFDDEPSPYVGHIDLQHSLSSQVSKVSKDIHVKLPAAHQEEQQLMSDIGENYVHDRHVKSERIQKHRRVPLIAPPDGSYRLPEQGQLQIIIKNPNKTAVKLFLVPYDLTGMEPGTKTFVRQRLYSTGPILGKPLASTSSPQATSSINKKEKPALRYLIHVNICCPTRGRFYLYQHIRLVFANRVPDNKEQLRTETQVPEPRFSTWKPSLSSGQVSSAGVKLTLEKAFRRRSSGFGFGDELAPPWTSKNFDGDSTFPFFGDIAAPPVPPIPFNLPPRMNHHANDNRHDDSDEMDIDASRPPLTSTFQSPPFRRAMQHAESLTHNLRPESSDYEKLNWGDSGYGGLFGRPTTPERSEGLLARRLKSLGTQSAASVEEYKPEVQN